jgi:hypothetical protein
MTIQRMEHVGTRLAINELRSARVLGPLGDFTTLLMSAT